MSGGDHLCQVPGCGKFGSWGLRIKPSDWRAGYRWWCGAHRHLMPQPKAIEAPGSAPAKTIEAPKSAPAKTIEAPKSAPVPAAKPTGQGRLL